MLPDRVSNPGPLTYESGALLIALRGPAPTHWKEFNNNNNHVILICYLPVQDICISSETMLYDKKNILVFQGFHFYRNTSVSTKEVLLNILYFRMKSNTDNWEIMFITQKKKKKKKKKTH